MTYSKEHQEKGAELMKTLVEKAWESAIFKEQLMSNPTLAIQEVTGESFIIPEDKKLVVEDQTNESIIYLNIPSKPDYSEMELTDEQLEIIAGGEVVGTASLVLACIGLFGGGIAIGMAIK